MRQMVFAAGIALVLHAYLFSVEAGWMKIKTPGRSGVEPVTLTLIHAQPKHPVPSGGKNKQQIFEKNLIPFKNPYKKIIATKPAVKIRITPKKTVSDPKPGGRVERSNATLSIVPPEQEPFSQWGMADIYEDRLDISSLQAGEEIIEATSSETVKLASKESVPVIEALPVYKMNPNPIYPRLARRRGYQGMVLLEAFINDEGRVDDLRILESSGHSVLDRSAIQTVHQWLFEPGRRGDEAIAMWVKVPVRFRLK